MWSIPEIPTPPRGGRMLLLSDTVIDVDRVLALTSNGVHDVILVHLDGTSAVTTVGVEIPEGYTLDEALDEISQSINKARGY